MYDLFSKMKIWDSIMPLINTLDRPVSPSLTLGMIRMCVGA